MRELRRTGWGFGVSSVAVLVSDQMAMRLSGAVAVAVGLLGGHRAEEVLGPALGQLVPDPGGDRRSQGEAGVAGHRSHRVDLGHVHGGGVAGQRELVERIDLGGVEPRRREERVLVGGDVEAEGVGADLRVVTYARPTLAIVVRGAVGAVVLHRQAVDGPLAGGVAGLADGDVQVVGAEEVPGGRVDVEGQHDVEPASGDPVEQAARVGQERPGCPGGPVDRRRVAVEAVLVGHPGHRVAGRVVHAQDVVDSLQHEAVADTQALVRRFQRELVTAIGGALVAVVQTVDAAHQLRARCRLGAGHGGAAVAAEPA